MSLQKLPYVHGRPVPIGTPQAACILIACALAFGALLQLPHLIGGQLGSWVGALAFVALQVTGLVVAVGPAWQALFIRPKGKDVLIALASVPVVAGLPALVAVEGLKQGGLVPNAVISSASALTALGLVNLLSVSAVQLLGEELITILPLMVLLSLLVRLGVRPWLALSTGWLVTSLAFGALHLPTYQWNVAQALLVIGTARLVLTGVYLLTRNLWASTLAHVVNDFLLIALAISLARSGAGSG